MVLSQRGKRTLALAFALVVGAFLAGCHRNDLTSGYGIGWMTLTNDSNRLSNYDFATYQVTVDAVELIGVNVGEIEVLDTPESVDFTKLKDISELWASASVPNDTYTAAIIVLDYTGGTFPVNISVVDNTTGKTVQVQPLDGTGAPFTTTTTVQVTLDPTNQAYVLPSYATTSGIRFALDFDLAASNRVDLTAVPPYVKVQPYFTVATSASDQKNILVRGPLVNTSVDEQSYSVYVRPFYDEVNTVGTLTLFNNTSAFNGASLGCPQNTPLYTINGTVYNGSAAITQLSETSAGSTMTLASTTYVPTVTPSVTAAVFCVNYMVGGSTLEDFYTYGLEGDVVARSGNTLTVRGPSLFLTADEYVTFQPNDYYVTVGPSTVVTQDDVASNAGFNYNSISVGQHIIARGICTITTTTNALAVVINTCASSNGLPTLDATGASSVNAGSVRLISTQLFGTLTTSAAGSLTMNAANFNQYPAIAYNFAGTGTSTAADAVPASYVVNTGSLTLPTDLTAGGPLWVDGIVAPFSAAPPDFNALDVVDEATEPATLLVTYSASTANNAAAFTTLTAAGLSFNLTNSLLLSAAIRIGEETIDMTTLATSPTFVPVVVPTPPPPIKVPTSGLTTADLPPTYLPLFCEGNNASGVACFNTFSQFVSTVSTGFTAATPASVYAVTARGTYDRASNTFTASAIDVVLD